MLDDRNRRQAARIEFRDKLQRRIGIRNIVEGKRFALQLAGGRDAEPPIARQIETGGLVRVFAVAEGAREAAAKGPAWPVPSVGRGSQPIGDGCVVGGGTREGPLGEAQARGAGGRPAMAREFGDQRPVVVTVDHNRDIAMIFCCSADHGGAADVDVLDAFGERRALGHGLLERVQIDDQEIDRRDVVGLHRSDMIRIVAARQKAPMHLWVERLESPIHHLGEAGQAGDVADWKPSGGQCRVSASGRNELDAVLQKSGREFDDVRFVGHREKGTSDRSQVAHRGLGRGRPCRISRRSMNWNGAQLGFGRQAGQGPAERCGVRIASFNDDLAGGPSPRGGCEHDALLEHRGRSVDLE